MVHEFKPRIGLHADGAEPAWDSVSLSLSAPSTHSLSLPLNWVLEDEYELG